MPFLISKINTQDQGGSKLSGLAKKMPTLDTIGRNADGIGLFGGGGSPPQISQLKQKIQTGGSQKLAGSEPQNSIEIHSVLFEMRFFKKGAVFIFRKRALNWHCKVNMKK